MKTFSINEKIIIFGSNAKENTTLLKTYQEFNPDGLWFHLSDYPSSHGFYLGGLKLSKEELRGIGNELLRISKYNKKEDKYYMDIVKLSDVRATKTVGLVEIRNERRFYIK